NTSCHRIYSKTTARQQTLVDAVRENVGRKARHLGLVTFIPRSRRMDLMGRITVFYNHVDVRRLACQNKSTLSSHVNTTSFIVLIAAVPEFSVRQSMNPICGILNRTNPTAFRPDCYKYN